MGSGGSGITSQSQALTEQQRALASKQETLQWQSVGSEMAAYQELANRLAATGTTEAAITKQLQGLYEQAATANNAYQGILSQLQGVQQQQTETNLSRLQAQQGYVSQYAAQVNNMVSSVRPMLSELETQQQGVISAYADTAARARAQAARAYGNVRSVEPYGTNPISSRTYGP